ncbi:hypothetical protein [Lysinibacillus sp. 3P01SB]|uniref:hypothetical protein n=1 Tax=Lysinibacillus sp. 3P01SB TaxID=3132284 RepID=UPI0039A4A4D9
MKKTGRKKWIIISALALVLIIVGVTYYTSLSTGYESLEDMNGFPIPKSAELEKEEDNAKHYEWDGASAANGISKGYQLVITNRGWEETDRQGETITYQQDDFVLQLQYEDDRFSVFEVEE